MFVLSDEAYEFKPWKDKMMCKDWSLKNPITASVFLSALRRVYHNVFLSGLSLGEILMLETIFQRKRSCTNFTGELQMCLSKI